MNIGKEKGERISVAAIGPAGEKIVRFANIVNNRRCYGRGGAGAVMGSKNLKAVVLRGNQRPGMTDAAAFKEVVGRSRRKTAAHPLTGKEGHFPKVGTMMTLDLTNETGTLPTRNWQENTSEHAGVVNADAFSQSYHSTQKLLCMPHRLQPGDNRNQERR